MEREGGGSEEAERQFFGETLDEHAQREPERQKAAGERAERKFFGGETLEETNARRKADVERAAAAQARADEGRAHAERVRAENLAKRAKTGGEERHREAA